MLIDTALDSDAVNNQVDRCAAVTFQSLSGFTIRKEDDRKEKTKVTGMMDSKAT